MGMYTEFNIDVKLLYKTPGYIIEALKQIIRPTEQEVKLKIIDKKAKEHPFFQCKRWDYVLSSESHLDFLEEDKKWHLKGHSDFKNYNKEIQLFLNWIKPYLDHNNHQPFGEMKYEEWEEKQHIQLKEGEIRYLCDSDYRDVRKEERLFVIREYDSKYQETKDVFETRDFQEAKLKFEELIETSFSSCRFEYEWLTFQDYEIKEKITQQNYIENVRKSLGDII